MMWLLLVLAGCDQPAATRRLAGDAVVTIDHLGPVTEAPEVKDGRGRTVPVPWTIDPPGVAHLEGGVVHADRPGRAELVAPDAADLRWTLVVAPAVTLRFVDPPSELSVGDSATLQLEADHQGAALPLDDLSWTSHDPEILSVTPEGRILGVAPGLTWVTAALPPSRATLEVRVSAP